MKLSEKRSLTPVQPISQPLGRSLLLWSTIVLLAGVLGVPALIEVNTPRIISALYIDVSASNQPFQAVVQSICQDRLKYLKDGDVLIDGQFAEQSIAPIHQIYTEQQRANLRANCQAATQPNGIGKRPGTTPLRAWESLQSLVQSERSQRNHDRVAAVFVIQAAERVLGQPNLDWAKFKQQVQDFVADGNVILIIADQPELQQLLLPLLAEVRNARVCTYDDGKDNLKWAFDKVR